VAYDPELASINTAALHENPNPGSGIVMGYSERGLVQQVFWKFRRDYDMAYLERNVDTVTSVHLGEHGLDRQIHMASVSGRAAIHHVMMTGNTGHLLLRGLVENPTLARKPDVSDPDRSAVPVTRRIGGIVNVGKSRPYLGRPEPITTFELLARARSSGGHFGTAGEDVWAIGSLNRRVQPGFGIGTHEYGNYPEPPHSGQPAIFRLYETLEETALVYRSLFSEDRLADGAVKEIGPGNLVRTLLFSEVEA